MYSVKKMHVYQCMWFKKTQNQRTAGTVFLSSLKTENKKRWAKRENWALREIRKGKN